MVYGLKKYLRLATAGNPTVILLLYAQEHHLFHVDQFGRELHGLRGAVVSQACRLRFTGYLNSQRDGLLAARDEPERAAKWASHMVRLGFQGRELLATDHLSLPMPDEQAAFCRAVKRGEVSLDEAFATAGEAEEVIEGIGGFAPRTRARPGTHRGLRWTRSTAARSVTTPTEVPGTVPRCPSRGGPCRVAAAGSESCPSQTPSLLLERAVAARARHRNSTGCHTPVVPSRT